MKLSYAQNFEDVILWRVLGDIENGVYVDVGANHYSIDSVTKLFYDFGWSGVNIEPTPESYKNLCQKRPRDINIQKCATDVSGKEIEILDVLSTGLSTSHIENKDKFLEMGHKVKHLKIKGETLTNIWSENELSIVHFLKIDVEGMEKEVLAGLDLNSYRPWVVLIESINPVTNQPNYSEWENNLLDADYEFVYFDGLNRFYVASEKAELKLKFANPPNILDDQLVQNILHLTRFVYPSLTQQNEELQKIKSELESNLNSAQSTLSGFESDREKLQNENTTLKIVKGNLENDKLKLENDKLKLEKSNLKDRLEFEKSDRLLEKIGEQNVELEVEQTRLLSEREHLVSTNKELHEISTQFISVTSSTIWKCTLPLRKLSIFAYSILAKFRILINYCRLYGLRKTLSRVKQVFIKPIITNNADKYNLSVNERDIFNKLRQGKK